MIEIEIKSIFKRNKYWLISSISKNERPRWEGRSLLLNFNFAGSIINKYILALLNEIIRIKCLKYSCSII